MDTVLSFLVLATFFFVVGMAIYTSRNRSVKAVPVVPVEARFPIGDHIRYTDKRTGNYRGRAFIVGHNNEQLVLCHSAEPTPSARQFTVHSERILERS